MKNKIIILCFLLSLNFSAKQKFIFLFELDGQPISGEIKYTLKNENLEIIDDKEQVTIKRGKRYKHKKKEEKIYIKRYREKKYYQYTIEEDFEKYLEQNKEVIINFSGSVNNSYVSGQQKLSKDLWFGSKISSKHSRINAEWHANTYFVNTECVKGKYSDNSKGIVIHVKLSMSRLDFEIDLFDAFGNDIDKNDFKIYFNKLARQDLDPPSDELQRNGNYQCIIKAKDGLISDLEGKAGYQIYIISDNYKTEFINIDTDKLFKNKKQSETIRMQTLYPFEVLEQDCDDGMMWSFDCDKCVCSAGKFYYKKLGKCVKNCPKGSSGQTIDGEYVCIEYIDPESQNNKKNIESEVQKKKRLKKERDKKIKECVNIKMKQFKEKNSDLDMIIKKGFNAMFSSNSEIDMSKKESEFKMICEKTISQPLEKSDEKKENKNDFRSEFKSLYDTCSTNEEDENSLRNILYDDQYLYLSICDSNNVSYLEDMFFLIDLSDILYNKIRESREYAFPDILDKIENSNKKTGSQLIDIIQLQLLYFQIDAIYKSKIDTKSSLDINSYRDVPDPYSRLTIHRLQRLQFYDWYFDILFKLSKHPKKPFITSLAGATTKEGKLHGKSIRGYWRAQAGNKVDSPNDLCYLSLLQDKYSKIGWSYLKPGEVIEILYKRLRRYDDDFELNYEEAEIEGGLLGGEMKKFKELQENRKRIKTEVN